MTVARVQVVIPNGSLDIPANVSVNTWHFQAAALDAGTLDDIEAQLEIFYAAVDTYFSSNVGSTGTMKFYDLQDPLPRVPLRTSTFTISDSTGTAFPNEVALCLSYSGAQGSGINPRRNRGRIFLGPMDADTGAVDNGDVRVVSGTRNAVVAAAEVLAEARNTTDCAWVVFSPTTAGPEPWSASTLDSSCVAVESGWVDNAFDTIRSRGLTSNARSTFTATLV